MMETQEINRKWYLSSSSWKSKLFYSYKQIKEHIIGILDTRVYQLFLHLLLTLYGDATLRSLVKPVLMLISLHLGANKNVFVELKSSV